MALDQSLSKCFLEVAWHIKNHNSKWSGEIRHSRLHWFISTQVDDGHGRRPGPALWERTQSRPDVDTALGNSHAPSPLWNACRGEPAKAHSATTVLEAHGDWPGTCDSQGTSSPGELVGSEQEESVSIGPMSFGDVQPHQTRARTQARAHEHERRGSPSSGALLVFGFSFPSPQR